MRNIERYELTCWRCKSHIEIPCAPPHKCPKCGTLLPIQWRPPTPPANITPEQDATKSAA